MNSHVFFFVVLFEEITIIEIGIYLLNKEKLNNVKIVCYLNLSLCCFNHMIYSEEKFPKITFFNFLSQK